MNVLFVISVGCFFALFVTALAIARHVRIVETHRDEAHEDPRQFPREHTGHVAPRPTEQSLRNLAEHKEPDWRFLISEERQSRFSDKTISPMVRKPPAPARPGRLHRPDWAYFNKDLGDLSDPYQPQVLKALTRSGGRR